MSKQEALFHVEKFPIGFAICDATGRNLTHFPEKPGAKFFTDPVMANLVCAQWNERGMPDFEAES